MSISGMGSGPSFPDDAERGIRETSKLQRQSSPTPGAGGHKGALLSKDSLDVPLEVYLSSDIEGAEAGRPSLSPLFRTRMGDENESKDASHAFYLELRNKLPPYLKEKLSRDEALDFEDRDPDLIALDTSLKVDANLMAVAQQLSLKAENNETVQETTQSFVALPHRIQARLLDYETMVVNHLDRYAATSERNDPSHTILTNTLTHMKEALEYLHSQIKEGVGKSHERKNIQPK